MSNQPDDSVWRGIMARVAALAKRPSVRVGVFADAGEEDGVSLVDIALYNEFGTEHIPERSFLRSTFFEGHAADELKTVCEKLCARVVKGSLTEVEALELLGAWATKSVKKTIRDFIDPENAPATIAAKGSSLPLVNFGQLINSITWIVDK